MPNRVTAAGLRMPDSAFKSQAPAYAEVARSLAGRAADLYELATGEPAVAGESPLTPTNPQGLIGWDLSGPPWGSALRMPIAWFGGRSADTANSLRPAHVWRHPQAYSEEKPAIIHLRFWNRAHDKLGPTAIAPLSRLFWVLNIYRVAGTTTPSVVLRTWNPRLGQKRETAQTQTVTQTAAETRITSATLWVSALPGWNTVVLEASTTGAITGYITCGALQNLEKRTH